jgi:ketosteroid isomerase-like protein
MWIRLTQDAEEQPMPIALPPLVAAFVRAQNAHDPDALAACFAPDAVVRDEGEEFRGLSAVREWGAATFEKYAITLEPTTLAGGDGEILLTAQASGTFPGSPIQLQFHFTVEEDKIAALSCHA